MAVMISSFVVYLAGAALWLLCAIVYRRYLHPAASIPGPFLASITHLYSFYYSHICNGRFYLQIEKLHQRYGPVVRIAPNEVHLSDARHYDTIYHVGSKYGKDGAFYAIFGVTRSAFATADNELHRRRRAPMAPFFSRKMVLGLEAVVQGKVRKLCRIVARQLAAGQSVDLHHGFRAVSVDIITDYAFDRCDDLLDQPGFGIGFFDGMESMVRNAWLFLELPGLMALTKATPIWVAAWLKPSMGTMLRNQARIKDVIVAIQASMASPDYKPPAKPTIYHQLLHPDPDPDPDPSDDGQPVPDPDVAQMADEANSIMGAASETVGNTLTLSAFHVLSNRAIYRTLVAELAAAFPDPRQPLDFLTLEQLPYLTAVIKEGLRLSFGVTSRLPRITPEPGATFNGHYLPAGTTVAMSSWLMHRNEAVFPASATFDPDRWLDPAAAKALEKHIVAFGRGSRICVGVNLAYCELYIALATFFRCFPDLRVDGTTAEDLVYEDFFSTYHPAGARKLHVVRVKEVGKEEEVEPEKEGVEPEPEPALGRGAQAKE
ncbi:MAG: hypothetical protein M1826_004538 [Phylliscum demangeonii]|nr:MAG: hypothetical protein M1826_004538 [Phylliscum demangeonii]